MPDRSALEQLSQEQLIALVLALQQQVEQLAARVATLEKGQGPGGPPTFVRASVVRKERAQRQGRAQSFVRRREEPTQVCLHAASRCPDCGRPLSGGSEHRRRQVIEVPPAPAQVTDHVIVARWCGACRRRVLPAPDLSGEALGRHRFGLRLTSLIAYLKTALRLPVRQVTALLRALYGLRVSAGEVCELLHAVAARGREEYGRLQGQVRASPYVHADETGWREDGRNGYLWSFNTPGVRYFVYDHSRAGSVPAEVLGEQFGGITVSDFYGGYNAVGAVRQRCWVHLLRDLHALTQAHPEDEGVQAWARAVRSVYDAARAFQEQARQALARHGQNADRFGLGVFARRARRHGLEQQLYALAQPYLPAQCAEARPQTVLSRRIESFLPELLTFVEHVEVPSENNAAERSVRPAVIARKISGGTRSAKGSATKSVLLSLFGTWQAQGQDPLEACRRMLTQPMLTQSAPAA